MISAFPKDGSDHCLHLDSKLVPPRVGHGIQQEEENDERPETSKPSDDDYGGVLGDRARLRAALRA